MFERLLREAQIARGGRGRGRQRSVTPFDLAAAFDGNWQFDGRTGADGRSTR